MPPALGMAVVNSTILIDPIIAQIPPMKYETKIEGPLKAKAAAGSIKIPELIIDPIVILSIGINFKSFFSSILNLVYAVIPLINILTSVAILFRSVRVRDDSRAL